MKLYAKYTLIIFVLLSLVILDVCKKQSAEWKGTIQEKNGVSVVRNPKEPIYQEEVLIIKEELSIGDDEADEDYMFSEMISFAIDKEGKFYILDRKESKIKVFDCEGKYIRTIGKQGQGPGEMNQPIGIHITPNHELIVEDVLSQKLVFFTFDGKFLKILSTAKVFGLGDVAVDSQGNMIARQFAISDKGVNWEVKKYDSDLNPLFSIGAIEISNPLEREINPFRFFLFYKLGKEDDILYGNSEEYEIKILNSEGTLVKRITKKYVPVKITKEDKKKYFNNIPSIASAFKDRIALPEFYPAYQSFSIDEQGRIFVRTYEKGKEKGEYLIDVFDIEGKHIAKIPFKGEPKVWKGEKLYAIEETEAGFRVLKRYSVHWKK